MGTKLTLLIFVAILFSFCSSLSGAVAYKPNELPIHQLEKPFSNGLKTEHLGQSIGRKLTFRERFALRFVQKKINKQYLKSEISNNKALEPKKKTGKSQIVAFLLCLFLGLLGIHRFYLGYTGMGVLYILTVGIFGIGWLIDLILLIIPNGLSPKGETKY